MNQIVLSIYLRRRYRLKLSNYSDVLPINAILIRSVGIDCTLQYHYYISNGIIYRKTSNGYNFYISIMELVSD
jgi:hypothetical protein